MEQSKARDGHVSTWWQLSWVMEALSPASAQLEAALIIKGHHPLLGLQFPQTGDSG